MKTVPELVIKATAAAAPGDDPAEFVMSDSTVDRMGDVIESDGWQLDNFNKNPIALFGHDSRFPIGKWREVRVVKGELRGFLDLLDPVSDRMREVRAAVGAGVLRAVSVGFHPKKYEPLEGSKVGGLRFLESELVECSLVSVPANPNALAIAKALGISREGIGLIFGGHAEPGQSLVPIGKGGIARTQHFIPKATQAMQTFAERISNGQDELAALREQLGATNADDTAALDMVTGQIGDLQRRLDSWRAAEAAIGEASEVTTRPGRQLIVPAAPVGPGGSGQQLISGSMSGPPRTWAMPKAKDPAPGFLFLRHIVAKTLSHIDGHKSPEQILTERYGHYGDFAVTREVHQWYMRAATAPAETNVVGWAQELAVTQYGDFIEALMPAALYAKVSPRGFRVTLGRFGQVSLPTRTATPTVAGSFVAEGAPIPVRQANFVPVVLGLKKMAVISTYSREMSQHSTPNIELLLRQLIQDDTQVSVDTIFIDANPATSVRPAGIRNGIAGLTPTAGGGFAALVGDLKALVGALAAVNALRDPVWLMNDQQAVSIGLATNANGAFPFGPSIETNNLLGYPVFRSTTVPLGTVMLVASEELMSTTGDTPDFQVSDQATLHMEDTTPLAIGTPGSPPTVAAPVRSLFQTDSLALRMILPMNWAFRRTPSPVAWVAAVTW